MNVRKVPLDQKECRLIIIARIQANLTQKELAAKVFYTSAAIGQWESGILTPKWTDLYQALPQLEQMRGHHCDEYCDRTASCGGDVSKCHYTRRGVNAVSRPRGKKKNA